MPLNTLAQGTNDGLGEEEVDLKSLYEMVTKHEQKSKALELYINYGTAAQATHDSRNGEWGARIYNRYLKIDRPYLLPFPPTHQQVERRTERGQLLESQRLYDGGMEV